MRGESEATRQRILEAALDIAGAEGIEALSTRKIAARAGVNLGLLHYYFGSKDALVAEAAGVFFSRIRALAEAMRPEDAPEDALARLLGGVLEHASRRPGLLFSFLGRALGELSHDPHGSETLEGPFRRFSPIMSLMVERVSGILARGLEPAPAGLVAERTLRLIVSVFHPILLTPLPGLLVGLPMDSAEARAAYVRHAVADALRRPD